MSKICVIGGGASGLMAAVTAADNNKVTIFEKNKRLGKKLLITGKGRCNIANLSNIDTLIENTYRNGSFMYSAFNEFSAYETYAFFEENGLPLKVERGNRVFPQFDRAGDVVAIFERLLREKGVKIINEDIAEILIKDGAAHGVSGHSGRQYEFDKIIMAAGGASYKATGSDGAGYEIAQKAGHSVTPLSPSLVPVETVEAYPARMQGLSLKNIAIKLVSDSEILYTDFGEMLFTHFGLSGPVILSLSAHIKEGKSCKIEIDLKPALNSEQLDARILRDFNSNLNKEIKNVLGLLLPEKMIEPMLDYCGINVCQKINSFTKEQRQILLKGIKSFILTVKGLRPLEEAIITCGGVDVKEIDPRTMESKLVKSLYFAGEIIDVSAYTGGFNLQIAFSTGYLAGKSN